MPRSVHTCSPVAGGLGPVLAQTSTNPSGPDSKLDVQLFQLKYAKAAEVTRLVSELFGKGRESTVVAVAD